MTGFRTPVDLSSYSEPGPCSLCENLYIKHIWTRMMAGKSILLEWRDPSLVFERTTNHYEWMDTLQRRLPTDTTVGAPKDYRQL